MASRAERRAHRDRIKRNRRFYWGRDLAREPGRLAQAATTPATCSCMFCRNPRKWAGPTMQERRAGMTAKNGWIDTTGGFMVAEGIGVEEVSRDTSGGLIRTGAED